MKKSLIFAAVCLSYFLLGYFGLQLATLNDATSPIWPASGMAIGVLIYFGNWLAPAILLGSFLANLTIDPPILGGIATASGNMLEALIGAQIIRWGLNKNYFKNYSETFIVFFAAAAASVASASVGVFSLTSLGIIDRHTMLPSWFTWWSGNALGILLLLPFFLELMARPKEKINLTFQKCLTVLFLCVSMIMATYLVFVQNFNQAFSWSITPFLMIVGLLVGRLFSRVFLIVLSLLIIAFAFNGHGPFALGNISTNLLYVQTLLTTYAISILFVKPFNTQYKISLNYIIGISFGWIMLFFAIYQASVFEKNLRMDDIDESAELAIHTLNRMNTRYESILLGSSALFKIKPQVTEDDFRTFTESVELNKFYDASLGLGFVQKVYNKDLKNYLKKEGLDLKYLDEKVAKLYDHHYIIKFIEPKSVNVKARGLDIGSNEIRRKAINRALEKNDIVATETIFLVQDNFKSNGFLIMKPVWSANDEFIGFTYAPVLASVFFGKSFDKFSHQLRARVSLNGKQIYSTNQSMNESFPRDSFYRKKAVTIFGVKHLIEFYPTEQFFSFHSGSTAALGLLLNIFMLFISAFLLEQLTFSQRAEAVVEERTKELEVSKMQLMNSSKMASLGEMASGVAHEINNPLAIIQGKVKVITMMLEDLEINHPKLYQEIHKIKLTTDRIEKIVKGLRNFSRASNNDPFEPIPLSRILYETLDLCQEKFKANGIKMKISDIPDVSIMCRPSQISQVLINLLNNSSDAIETSEDKWIEISFLRKENKHFSIFITDSGAGIPAEHLEKIMEPFFTTKEVRKGTGLGLSIAKSIIDSHQGLLWIDTKHPNTRFVIDIKIV